MSDVKEIIDQYAAENQALRQQAEQLMLMLRAVVVQNKDQKSQVRISKKLQNEADKYALEIKQLKTSIVLTAKEKPE